MRHEVKGISITLELDERVFKRREKKRGEAATVVGINTAFNAVRRRSWGPRSSPRGSYLRLCCPVIALVEPRPRPRRRARQTLL